MSSTGSVPRPRPARPARPSSPQADYNSSVTLKPEELRSPVITHTCLQAAIVGAGLGLIGLLALFVPGRRGLFLIYGGMAAVLFYSAWSGSQCQPVGKTLLTIYSALTVLVVPIGTIQGVFQILHLARPEAMLVFSGRDRFSPDEARDIHGRHGRAGSNLSDDRRPRGRRGID